MSIEKVDMVGFRGISLQMNVCNATLSILQQLYILGVYVSVILCYNERRERTLYKE